MGDGSSCFSRPRCYNIAEVKKMPRQAREGSPTGYYHVMMRGNNREHIFTSDWQRTYFMELLKLANSQQVGVTAYCLMSNHVHIVVQGDRDDVSQAVKSMNIKYAMRFNKASDRMGHVFQDRFRSEIILKDNDLLKVIRYVHNNPVKARMVVSPGEYKWSSYGEYLAKPLVISETQREVVMRLCGNDPEAYKRFHQENDLAEFIDTQEETEHNRMQVAQGIIRDFCAGKDVAEAKDISGDMGELVGRLLRESRLSHRQIAGLLGVSNSAVHRASVGRGE
jgi:REP element-mobilizing transposase RayT